jgi:hypothetical protein
VEIDQSRKMAAALTAVGVAVELTEEPFGHTLTFLLDRGVFDRAVGFLAVQLKP